MTTLCRFCFEGNESGTLYNPCICIGSVKYVHDSCLFRWIDSKDTRERHHRCEICKTVYNIRYNHQKETDIDERVVQGNLLINPSIHVIVYALLLLRINKLIPVPTYDSSHNPNIIVEQNAQALVWNLFLYHIMYMMICVLYIEFTVHNRMQYYLHLITLRYSWPIVFHAFVWTYILCIYYANRSTTLIMCTAIQCYLGIYPIMHFMIIRKLNGARERVVMNI